MLAKLAWVVLQSKHVPSIEFFNPKISNAEKGFIGFIAMFAQDLTCKRTNTKKASAKRH